jgi:hypothetical protein
MARTLVNSEDLRAWLNAELRKSDECGQCDFGGIMMLQGTDAQGCNWSEPTLRCHGQPADVCRPAAQQVLTAARERFNVK